MSYRAGDGITFSKLSRHMVEMMDDAHQSSAFKKVPPFERESDGNFTKIFVMTQGNGIETLQNYQHQDMDPENELPDIPHQLSVPMNSCARITVEIPQRLVLKPTDISSHRLKQCFKICKNLPPNVSLEELLQSQLPNPVECYDFHNVVMLSASISGATVTPPTAHVCCGWNFLDHIRDFISNVGGYRPISFKEIHELNKPHAYDRISPFDQRELGRNSMNGTKSINTTSDGDISVDDLAQNLENLDVFSDGDEDESGDQLSNVQQKPLEWKSSDFIKFGQFVQVETYTSAYAVSLGKPDNGADDNDARMDITEPETKVFFNSDNQPLWDPDNINAFAMIWRNNPKPFSEIVVIEGKNYITFPMTLAFSQYLLQPQTIADNNLRFYLEGTSRFTGMDDVLFAVPCESFPILYGSFLRETSGMVLYDNFSNFFTYVLPLAPLIGETAEVEFSLKLDLLVWPNDFVPSVNFSPTFPGFPNELYFEIPTTSTSEGSFLYKLTDIQALDTAYEELLQKSDHSLKKMKTDDLAV